MVKEIPEFFFVDVSMFFRKIIIFLTPSDNFMGGLVYHLLIKAEARES